jgi:hypothetical protein
MLRLGAIRAAIFLSENCYADHALAGWKSDNQVK